ncbi:MAG TPA: 4-(cytidine 5'-diphospho)-2-C-methyl-D-erythritol kinase [Anaeromyxobacteraceae bacterium]|nr:4-(cytidine 5'-diphospho)-2-C-methyl-D-erythritol kinase [Anaeromyxobacteraceae bacterium]
MRLSCPAPAKVNLVLRVGPPRADGYHDILSLFAPLDLADEVRVTVRSRPGSVTCRCPGRPDLDGPGNLAARAAVALRDRLGRREGVDVLVVKRIPVVAGLGGGSADAAAVLRCLARAWRVRDRRLLAEVALSIGSDVPFFLGPGPAWVGGRGERLRPVPLATRHLVLLYPSDPELAIRAGEAYAWLDADRGDRMPRRGKPSASHPENDLMDPCLRRRPALAVLRARLAESGAAAPIMSGSGPTVFGVFPGARAARAAAGRLAARGSGQPGVEVIVARTRARMRGASPWKSPRSASSPSRRRS